MTGKDVLPDIREKIATMKRLEYSPLGKELENQTSVVEKQYQRFLIKDFLPKVFNHDEQKEPVKFKKEGPITADKSSLFYNNKYSFIEFKSLGKYIDNSLVSRYNDYLASFKQRFEEFKKSTPRKFKTKVKKRTAYNNAKNYIVNY